MFYRLSTNDRIGSCTQMSLFCSSLIDLLLGRRSSLCVEGHKRVKLLSLYPTTFEWFLIQTCTIQASCAYFRFLESNSMYTYTFPLLSITAVVIFSVEFRESLHAYVQVYPTVPFLNTLRCLCWPYVSSFSPISYVILATHNSTAIVGRIYSRMFYLDLPAEPVDNRLAIAGIGA